MANKFCQYCGNQMDDNSNFCQSCGKSQSISNSSSSTSSAPTQSSQPTYTAPYSNYNQTSTNISSPLTVGQYIGMFILTAIPFVGFILLLVWAFGSESNMNKKNYARAALILALIGIILSIIFSVALGGLLATIFSNFN